MVADQTREKITLEVLDEVDQERELLGGYPSPSRKQVLDALGDGEQGDGDLFAQLFRGRRCYDHAARKWYAWVGHHWRQHPGNAILDDVEAVVECYLRLSGDIDREAADAMKAGDKEGAKGKEEQRDVLRRRVGDLRKSHRRQAVITFAQTPRRLGIAGDEWDREPRRVACANGVLELLTEEPYIRFRDGRPDDYMKAAAPTTWLGIDTPAPKFSTCVFEVFGDDAALGAFFGRFVGYALAGDPVEHVFLICFGCGANGKTTIIEVLLFVLGPALMSPCETETILRGRDRGAGGASPELVVLRGLRLAVARESKEGRKLDEAVVKALSGQDTITARPLYGEPVTFRPTFTLVQLTNHKPEIDGADPAIWRRVLLLPFMQTFVTDPAEMGPLNVRPARRALLEELKAEASGVLAWAARGWADYRRRGGLDAPDTVRVATRAYRDAEDLEGRFLAECCEEDPRAEVKAGELQVVFEEWARARGADSRRWQRLSKRLQAQPEKYPRRTTKHGTFYRGLRLVMGGRDTTER